MFYPANGPESLTLNELIALNIARLGLESNRYFDAVAYQNSPELDPFKGLQNVKVYPNQIVSVLANIHPDYDATKSELKIVDMDTAHSLYGPHIWSFTPYVFEELLQDQNISSVQIFAIAELSKDFVRYYFSDPSQITTPVVHDAPAKPASIMDRLAHLFHVAKGN